MDHPVGVGTASIILTIKQLLNIYKESICCFDNHKQSNLTEFATANLHLVLIFPLLCNKKKLLATVDLKLLSNNRQQNNTNSCSKDVVFEKKTLLAQKFPIKSGLHGY
jgi:hypothetical protein